MESSILSQSKFSFTRNASFYLSLDPFLNVLVSSLGTSASLHHYCATLRDVLVEELGTSFYYTVFKNSQFGKAWWLSDKGICCQFWRPECDPWDPCGGKKEQISIGVLWPNIDHDTHLPNKNTSQLFSSFPVSRMTESQMI